MINYQLRFFEMPFGSAVIFGQIIKLLAGLFSLSVAQYVVIKTH